MKGKFAVAMLAIAMLCACALAQEMTAEDWLQKGGELFRNLSIEGAAEAYGAAIEAAGSNKTLLAAAWKDRGEALFVLSGREKNPEKREEANESPRRLWTTMMRYWRWIQRMPEPGSTKPCSQVVGQDRRGTRCCRQGS